MGTVSRRVSSFTFLLMLFAAVVVPLLVFGGYLLYRYTGIEQQRYEREALVTSRQVTAALDRELEGLISTLRTLSTSRSLRAGRLEDFHEQARDLAAMTGIIIVLRTSDGDQVLSSATPFQAPHESSAPFPVDEIGDLTSGNPLVTGVFESDLLPGPVVAVYLPITGSDGAPLLLGVKITTEQLLSSIRSSVPPGWLVGVGDKNKRYVLRTVDNAKWSGQPALREYVDQATGSEGVFTSINVEGDYLLAGYTYSELSGWLVAANIPLAAVQAPLRASIALFTAFGFLALLLSGGLAVLVGRRLTTSMSELAAQALAVGRGLVVSPQRSFLRELELAGRALSRASRELAERSREREQAIQRQQLLMNELNHRVKNTLASVQAMVAQTLRNARSIPEAREAITARLIALARAQDVLTRESWEGADLAKAIATALEPHGLGERHFAFTGPSVRLTPRATLAISLAIHELATNAAKYGALKAEGGRVRITWSIQETSPPRFLLTWTEHGGPPVEQPDKQGFGSKLIQKGLGEELFATVTVTYAPAGLSFRMETDLANVEDAAASRPTASEAA